MTVKQTTDAFERGQKDYATGASCPYSKLGQIRAWNAGRAEAEHRHNQKTIDNKPTQEYKS